MNPIKIGTQVLERGIIVKQVYSLRSKGPANCEPIESVLANTQLYEQINSEVAKITKGQIQGSIKNLSFEQVKKLLESLQKACETKFQFFGDKYKIQLRPEAQNKAFTMSIEGKPVAVGDTHIFFKTKA